MNIAMPTALTSSKTMCTLSMPGHERLKVGALASVLRKHPRPWEQPMCRLDTSGSRNDSK